MKRGYESSTTISPTLSIYSPSAERENNFGNMSGFNGSLNSMNGYENVGSEEEVSIPNIS